MHTTASFRLDYCNSIYMSLNLKLTWKLQLVQYAAVQVLTETLQTMHIWPVLYELHCSPDKQWISFKVLVFTFKALSYLGPMYLWDCLSWYTPQRALWSADKTLLVIPSLWEIWLPSTRSRAFSALAPTWWTSLLNNIHALWDLL